MNNLKECKICKQRKVLKKHRRICNSCMYFRYLKPKVQKKQREHPFTAKLHNLYRKGGKVGGLLPILEEMYKRNPCCEYCGIALNTYEVWLDHKIPLVRQGSPDNPLNWAISCRDCNLLKGTKTYDEFKLFIKEYIKRFKVNTEPSPKREGVTTRDSDS